MGSQHSKGKMANATAVQAAVDFHGFLQPDDGVGISFWIISIAMVASTVFFGYLLGTVDDNVLNLTYNLADMLNKIWFVAAIWHAAKQETAATAKSALLA